MDTRKSTGWRHAREGVDHLLREFRGDIATVVMQLDAIRSGLAGGLSEKQARWLARASADCKRVVLVIDDYRDLLRMEAGTFEPCLEEVDLGGVIAAFCAEINELAEARNVGLSLQRPESLPVARLDGSLLSRVLRRMGRTLVEYAVPGQEVSGTVVVTRGRRRARLVVELGVPGSEMPQAVLDTVFDRRSQACLGLKLGKGYGMLFCRQAARQLGGTFHLRPWPGKGTRAVLAIKLDLIVR